MRGLVSRLAKHGDASRRIAVVYAGDKATFGMLRMAQLVSDMPTTFETFTDIEAAEEWLRS